MILTPLLLVIAAPAVAQTADRGRPALDQARRLYGLTAFEESIAHARKGLAVASDSGLRADLHAAIGLNYAALGREQQARNAFREALLSNPKLAFDPVRTPKAALELFRRTRESLRGNLVVSSPRRAKVYVDGSERGQTPLSVFIPIGVHRVRVVSVDGQHELTRQVVIRYQRREQLTADLGPPLGKLSVISAPESDLFLDGKLIGKTPLKNRLLDARGYWIKLSAPGHRDVIRKVEITAGKHRRLTLTLKRVEGEGLTAAAQSRSSSRWPWIWTLAGTGAAALGVGIGLGLAASSQHDEYLTTPDPGRGSDLKHSIRAKDIAANVLFGVAATSAVASLVLFLTRPGPEREPAVSASNGALLW